MLGDDARRDEPLPHVTTASWSFVRWHFGARGRRGSFSDTEIRKWAARVRDLASAGPLWGYFNNDWEGFAVENARRLKRLLG